MADRELVVRQEPNSFNLDYEEGSLAPTASAQERIAALVACGLSVDELADALQVSESTIRNWQDGGTPRKAADRALDDLRTIVAALADSGVSGSRAASWLRSRNSACGYERPLDLILRDPLLSLAAAEEPHRTERQPRQFVSQIALERQRRGVPRASAGGGANP
jgi:DNA-binding transcriptional regulator YiaG